MAAALVPLHAAQDVVVVADDDVGPAIDGEARAAQFVVAQEERTLVVAAVELDHDDVGRLPRRRDVVAQVIHVFLQRHGRADRRIARRPDVRMQVTVMIEGAQRREARPVVEGLVPARKERGIRQHGDLDRSRPAGSPACARRRGCGRCPTCAMPARLEVLVHLEQAAVPGIQRVVVGQREQVESRACDAPGCCPDSRSPAP